MLNLYSHLKTVHRFRNKMKLSLLFVAILGVAAVAAVPTGKDLTRDTRSLADDWEDFKALIDTDAILEIVVQYLAEDAEVQAVVVYLLSDDFKDLAATINTLPEFLDFLNYLDTTGLDVWKYVDLINEWLGLDGPSPGLYLPEYRMTSTRITGGLAGLWADLKAVLPLAELRALFEEKLQTSPDFANLVAALKSDAAKAYYDALKANEEYQRIRATLISHGLDIEHFLTWLKDLIGWE